MNPRTALAIDTVCRVLSTIAIYLWVSHTAALVVGLFALGYLTHCVRTMIRIIKVEQIMQVEAMRHYPFEDAVFEELDDERDYH